MNAAAYLDTFEDSSETSFAASRRMVPQSALDEVETSIRAGGDRTVQRIPHPHGLRPAQHPREGRRDISA